MVTVKWQLLDGRIKENKKPMERERAIYLVGVGNKFFKNAFHFIEEINENGASAHKRTLTKIIGR